MSLFTILQVIHIVGLALCVGAATVKVLLVFKYRSDTSFIPVFLKVSPTITRQIVVGMILMAASGITWLVDGYGFSTLLIVKIVLFAIVFILGPIIDNVVEPKLRKFAPAANETPSPEFALAQNLHTALELIATGLFYAIIVIWIFR